MKPPQQLDNRTSLRDCGQDQRDRNHQPKEKDNPHSSRNSGLFVDAKTFIDVRVGSTDRASWQTVRHHVFYQRSMTELFSIDFPFDETVSNTRTKRDLL